MNTCTCWMVAEERDKYEEYSALYPNHVLFIDRSFTQDTEGEKALEGTTQLHEVASCATEAPSTLPRVWPAKVANLPCNCRHCCVDPINTECKYTPWRKARMINVVEALKEGEVAVRGPFEGMLVGELKDLLRANNLRLTGNKPDLLARLIDAGVQDNRAI